MRLRRRADHQASPNRAFMAELERLQSDVKAIQELVDHLRAANSQLRCHLEAVAVSVAGWKVTTPELIAIPTVLAETEVGR